MAKQEIIPPNIDDGGKMLGGLTKRRKLIEAGIAAFITLCINRILALLFLPILVLSGITLAIGVPSVIICIIGIGDLSVTEWLMDKMSFRKSQRIYPFKIPVKNELKEDPDEDAKEKADEEAFLERTRKAKKARKMPLSAFLGKKDKKIKNKKEKGKSK